MTKTPAIAPRRAPGRVGAGLALAVLLLGPRVQADPPTRAASPPPDWKWERTDLRRVAGIELVYTRGPGTERLCSDEQTFRNAVAVSFNGFDAFEPARPDEAILPLPLKRLEIAIVRRKAEIVATMEWFGEGRSFLYRREYTQPITECDRLFRSMVSSASVSITIVKPPLPDAPPSPSPAPSPAPTPGPAVRLRAQAPPAPSPGPGFGPRLRFGAAPLLAFELMPGFAAGGAVDAAVRWPSASLALEGRVLVSPSTESVGVEGVAIDTVLGAVAAVPCLHVGWFFGCGLLELGAMRFTDGGDEGHVETRDPLFAAGGLRAGVEWPFTERFAVRGFADGACVFTRTTLLYNEKETWTTPLLFGGIGVGLTAAF
jgi:hypothetical protein